MAATCRSVRGSRCCCRRPCPRKSTARTMPITSVPAASPIARAHPPACANSTSQARSEEHTSELQSQSNLVCRLLLEKKKTQATHANQYNRHKSQIIMLSNDHYH